MSTYNFNPPCKPRHFENIKQLGDAAPSLALGLGTQIIAIGILAKMAQEAQGDHSLLKGTAIGAVATAMAFKTFPRPIRVVKSIFQDIVLHEASRQFSSREILAGKGRWQHLTVHAARILYGLDDS